MSPGGTGHTFAWDSDADLSTQAGSVRLQFTVTNKPPAGVDVVTFATLVGRPIWDVYGPELEHGVAKGLLDVTGETVRLTRPFLANAACELFV